MKALNRQCCWLSVLLACLRGFRLGRIEADANGSETESRDVAQMLHASPRCRGRLDGRGMKAGRFRRRLVGGFVGVVVAVVVLGGPAATWLQDRSRQAAPDAAWDAVYLVAGARAQDRRLAAMEAWAEAGGRSPPAILIGNDPQKSYYSREHGRNLTRTEWAEVKLSASSILQAAPRIVVPGRFSGTDAEMAALGRFLADRPDIRRLALVTCRFHGRRTLRRFAAYAPDGVEGRLVPGTPHREDRQPWMVAAELLKLARDAVGLSRAPLLSRPAPPDA